MVDIDQKSRLREAVGQLRDLGGDFFNKAAAKERPEDYSDNLWRDLLDEEMRREGEQLRARMRQLSVEIAGAARGAPLVSEADLNDLRLSARRVLASIRFRDYHYSGVVVHHDEGIVLGVDPPSQQESRISTVAGARSLFHKATTTILELIDFISPAEEIHASALGIANYRPNTAFIMMAISRTDPELEDVKNGLRDVCGEFGITAITAEDIEHEGAITDRILQEIESSEFLIADLSGERPNVYYEIGHAHARGRRVALYRKSGTKLHFDVAHRNCPEYDNVTHLKQQLRKRMSALTNKPSN